MSNKEITVYDQLAERGIFLPRPKPDRLSEEMQSCRFSGDEMLELGQRLAKATGDKERLESEKSQVVNQFAAQISARDAEIGDISRKISSGYEWRKIECATFFDHPKKGMATVFRLDTGEEITSRRMTYDELQLSMNLVLAEPEPEPEPESEPEKAPESNDPLRSWQMRKRGAALLLDIYSDAGSYLWNAQFGLDTGDDGSLELFDGVIPSEDPEPPHATKPVEAAILAACAEIEQHARLKADESKGKVKSAWALVLSWAAEIAGEARVAIRTANEGAAA
jgi:hypothetical protein